MKYVIFEDNKQIVCAEVTNKPTEGNYLHVALPSNRQAKIKTKDVLHACNSKINLDIIHEIDLQLLWDCAPDEAIHAKDLAGEYFANQNDQNIYHVIVNLHKNPIFFSKKGQGFYQKTTNEQLNIALQAIQKRKSQEAQQQQYINDLCNGILPKNFIPLALDLLFKPNKNSIEYKALEEASKQLNVDNQTLLINLQAIANTKTYHEQMFFKEFYPHGIGFDKYKLDEYSFNINNLDLEDNTHLEVFSIDDSSTTEIDDAFSLQINADETFTVGVHIAAPSIGIKINDAVDKMAQQRLSTIYFPHSKITMLPQNIVEEFSLSEHKQKCAAVSLYLKFNNNFDLIENYTKINYIKVSSNIRYDTLEHIITFDNISNGLGDYPYKEQIQHLWHLSNHLYEQRQLKRKSFGLKAETNMHQIDYSFDIYENNGEEKIKLKTRQRGSPLDKIVAELMILANSIWAIELDKAGLQAMFRVQKSWGAVRTKMQTTLSPHEGLGVDGYIWATSPLRRYSDLLNQWQIIYLAQHGNTAKLISPFSQKESNLDTLTNIFNDTYNAYHEAQNKIERYWCIRWLKQENIKQVNGTLGKDGFIRFNNIPFSTTKTDLALYPRGSIISLDINSLDEVNLDAHVSIIKIDAPQEY